MGGGGANSLNSPEIGDNSEEKQDQKENKAEFIEPTIKPYSQYFEDLNISTATITEEDFVGNGSASNPYLVKSTRGFLYLTNTEVSGITLNNKHIVLDCDIMLNDEIFDEDGKCSGGDGVVYEWSPIITASMLSLDGKGHTISNYYINDITKEYVGLFNARLNTVQNLNLKDFFLCGKIRVSAISSVIGEHNLFKNINILSGTIAGSSRLYGLCAMVATLENCTNYANIKQIEEVAIKDNIAGFADATVNVANCKNFGNIEAYEVGYCGGIACSVRSGTIKNCQNFGKIEKKKSSACTGVGGIIGYAYASQILNCENYGDICSLYTNNAGICGYMYQISSYFYGCKNFGKIERGGGICGQGVPCDIFACENYGVMFNASGIYSKMEGAGLNKDNIATIKDCVVDCILVCTGATYGVVATTSNCDTDFVDCKIKASIKGTTPGTYGLITNQNNKFQWNFKNMDFKASFDVTNANFYLFYYVWGTSHIKLIDSKFKISGIDVYLCGETIGKMSLERVELDIFSNTKCVKMKNTSANKISLESVLLKEKIGASISNTSIVALTQNTVKINGLVRSIESNNVKLLEYYGSDFSQFCLNYKTGQLGIRAISGKNLFQGKVTEELLQNKGFVKKVL